MLAAVLARSSRPADGMRAAAELAAKAAAVPDGSGWAGCAAMAAAAVNDPERAAAALRRIASSAEELHAWGVVSPMVDGRSALRQSVFPWSNVAASPAVVEALTRIDAAIAVLRAEAMKTLNGM